MRSGAVGLGFSVGPPGRSWVLNTWRYQLEPGADGGTDVTESFALPSTLVSRLYWLISGSARGHSNAAGMRVTLERSQGGRRVRLTCR